MNVVRVERCCAGFGNEVPHPVSFRYDLVHDGLRELVLQFENVLVFALIRSREQVIAAADIDELSSDTQLISRFADAAFHYGADIQFRANVADVFVLPLEPERRRPGDHT
ncbi:MAG TPA: hypothetical protein VGL25_13550 [Casimicrobiaceae bacterium]|jgi:hypothetical protein